MSPEELTALEAMAGHFMGIDPNGPLGNVLSICTRRIRELEAQLAEARNAALEEARIAGRDACRCGRAPCRVDFAIRDLKSAPETKAAEIDRQEAILGQPAPPEVQEQQRMAGAAWIEGLRKPKTGYLRRAIEEMADRLRAEHGTAPAPDLGVTLSKDADGGTTVGFDKAVLLSAPLASLFRSLSASEQGEYAAARRELFTPAPDPVVDLVRRLVDGLEFAEEGLLLNHIDGYLAEVRTALSAARAWLKGRE